MSTKYFPDRFKRAIKKLIPKPNEDHINPINYRPISLLEVPGKITEKIINKRLWKYIEEKNIIPDTQHDNEGNRLSYYHSLRNYSTPHCKKNNSATKFCEMYPKHSTKYGMTDSDTRYYNSVCRTQ